MLCRNQTSLDLTHRFSRTSGRCVRNSVPAFRGVFSSQNEKKMVKTKFVKDVKALQAALEQKTDLGVVRLESSKKLSEALALAVHGATINDDATILAAFRKVVVALRADVEATKHTNA